MDIHSAMALIVPNGLYVIDNPTVGNLDTPAAWVTTNVGKKIFEALGVGDHIAYVGAKGSGAMGGHCEWRNPYTATLNAMIDKFLKGNNSAKTGEMTTDGTKPTIGNYYDWSASELLGDL